ncbi:MAG: ABC transporter ATP-binding protein [Bacillota bacterium]
MSEPVWALSARGVSRWFRLDHQKITAVDKVSLDIPTGTIIALVGQSGSGKSTLLSLLGGLDRPSEGQVFLDGKLFGDPVLVSESQRAELRQRHIGFVFQAYNLISTLTAVENVMFPLRLAKLRPALCREKAMHLLGEMGVADRAKHLPSQLSGGEQQRVAIARAIVHEPGIILADEPTGSVDSKNGAIIMDLITGLCRKRGKTVVLVTHDPSVAEVADRIVHLKDGKIAGVEA